MSDVFVSYSRVDKDFVRRLVIALADRDYDVWVDFEDIPFGADWWEEIRSGIESANTVLFIISPDSLESEYCGLEVNYALKNNKRLVPILYRQPAGQTVPPHISHIQWLDFSDPARFDRGASELVETLQTDLEAVRRHTRLLVRAREWENNGHSHSLLLRGEPLEEAESLLDGLPLTDLQREYIAASRQADLRRQMLDRFAWAFAGGLLTIAFWAFSTFRSDVLITPVRIIYTIALGQTFGLCLGAMAVLTGELPQGLQLWLPARAPGRVVLCLLLGVLAWGSYRWFLENLALTPQDLNALLLGGAGLAGGFIVRLLLRPPGWLAALLTAVFTFVPIIITYDSFFADTGGFVPLIFFDFRDQLFSIAIPMVALLAVGANAHALYRQARQFFHRMTPHEG
ncbi:MAG: toll/interleukin-1 receptor domain-containing protein [Chloroflexi bacterium]|nr:toll/interleukin-1 receptor domain-containing protein [Chloroflexota bacterium]MDL1882285.1 toll/interleukin-1 receptor domain-containing protein [Anaerolineae bacterium CFX8]